MPEEAAVAVFVSAETTEEYHREAKQQRVGEGSEREQQLEFLQQP